MWRTWNRNSPFAMLKRLQMCETLHLIDYCNQQMHSSSESFGGGTHDSPGGGSQIWVSTSRGVARVGVTWGNDPMKHTAVSHASNQWWTFSGDTIHTLLRREFWQIVAWDSSCRSSTFLRITFRDTHLNTYSVPSDLSGIGPELTMDYHLENHVDSSQRSWISWWADALGFWVAL